MKANITRELLREVTPDDKVMDIADTDVKGLIVRVMPGCAMTFAIRYAFHRCPEGN